jgi:hypothetical protein
MSELLVDWCIAIGWFDGVTEILGFCANTGFVLQVLE